MLGQGGLRLTPIRHLLPISEGGNSKRNMRAGDGKRIERLDERMEDVAKITDSHLSNRSKTRDDLLRAILGSFHKQTSRRLTSFDCTSIAGYNPRVNSAARGVITVYMMSLDSIHAQSAKRH